MIGRVAFLSAHTSPLAAPGSGDAGGMNVYVDSVARTFASMGIEVDVFTARLDDGTAPEVDVCPGYRVVHVDASGRDRAERITAFAEGVSRWAAEHSRRYDIIHSHYWLSGWAGALLSEPMGSPLVISFHTLGRGRDVGRGEAPQPLQRIAAETEIIARAGCVVASTPAEAADLMDRYRARPERVCVSPPGVDHGIFHLGESHRDALGLPSGPLAAYVGRIQPLKGVDVAIEAIGAIPEAHLVVVGGPSGSAGDTEMAHVVALAEQCAPGRVTFWPPMSHAAIADLYRSVDVLVVPSRSESFGLVAVEAQACGTPVVAARVGGLAYSVDDCTSGFLVDGYEPADWSKSVGAVLDDQSLRARLGSGAVIHASRFSWSATAARLIELYEGLL